MGDLKYVDLEDVIKADGSQVIWFAHYESESFSFMATGSSEQHAKSALLDGLARHGREYKCEPRWWVEDYITTCSAHQGETLRDQWPITSGGKSHAVCY